MLHAEKKYGQNPQAWEELGIYKEVKAAQNIRNTVSKRKRGQARYIFVIQCYSEFNRTP